MARASNRGLQSVVPPAFGFVVQLCFSSPGWWVSRLHLSSFRPLFRSFLISCWWLSGLHFPPLPTCFFLTDALDYRQ
ncbi:hypothetical protein SEA_BRUTONGASTER_51 [Gordonia phage BrutonGaster]|uniref:Uncharacterized protein n=1 Tax=Gordonia phage BrutonGaster TaxID=2530116 RepID=A0A482JH42_9CAUD|nr:hypothetical protein HOV26_gp131 [Gordonia phage BrutonGaster]QBP33268.1 hypothetical protein SEA_BRUTONGASTER_51 [Gordonia phage BrutonGaster]